MNDDQLLILSSEQTRTLFDVAGQVTAQVANYILDTEDDPNTFSEFLRGYDQGRLQGIVEIMNAVLGVEVSTWDVLDHFRVLRSGS